MKKIKENSIYIITGLLILLLLPISYISKLIILSLIIIAFCICKIVVIARDYLLDKQVRAFVAEQRQVRIRKNTFFGTYENIYRKL